MQIQSNLQPAEQPTLLSRLTQAAAQLETASKFALLCIFLSWFFLDTLVVTIGSLQLGVRFADISGVIADPTRLFFGIQGSSHRVMFSMVCMLCLLAPLLPHMRRKRVNWLAYLAPLALMVVCGALLYSRTSGERQGTGLVAGHVAVGFGGYLALVAALVLALRGARHFRNAPQT